MLAIDDGLVNGNLTAADFFFLVALILGFVAAILAAMGASPKTTSRAPLYASAVGWAAVGCLGLGWLLL